KFFPPGETVIFDGQDYVCEDCDYGVDPSSRQPLHKCSGCHKDIEHGQALMALDQHWHPNCFTCQKCGIVLHGEYMGKDGFAFCEKDYQTEFGVTCAGCQGYITGKVLQAGDKHYHPQCSRCAKCGQMFGEGEEMYLQGSEIWHPECSEMVREMERAEKERAEMEQREAERREVEDEARRREMEQREAERQDAERRDAERREAERREAEMRDTERREAERRDSERRDAERRDGERREAERRDGERREAERRDAERREAERLETEHRDAEQRERDRREREIEAERREAERREVEQREIERRDRERREIEYRESQRRDTERRDAERKREYYQQGQAGQQVDVGRKPSPDFDDLPPPPRPEELPKGPPAPPTRTDSRAKDWKARYGSLPRSGSGSVNGDAPEAQMR
ncbi:actin-binding LIM 1 isoform X21, partial [Paramuricea clavata]